ncbi:hypothetical protein RB195_025892 [Necator americanus]
MFCLLTLAVLLVSVYSYGVPKAASPPRHHYYPRPQYSPPIYPVYEPYWWPHWWRSSSSSSSDSRERRPSCRNLKTDCKDVPNNQNCFQAKISYYHEKNCKKATIDCSLPNKNVTMTTENGTVLASGLGTRKVATCKGNRRDTKWKADDANGRKVEFTTVRCLQL